MRQSLLWDRLLERFPKEHPAAVSQQNHNRARNTRKPARSGHPPTCQGDGDVRINTKKQPTPPGKTETRSGSRVHGGSFGQGSLSTRKPNRLTQGTIPRIPRIITHHFRRPFGGLSYRKSPYHAYHAYHAPFPSAFWAAPTKEPPYHAYHAYHAPFPSAFWGLPLPKNLLTTHTTHITHHFRLLLGSVPTKEPPYHAYHAYHAPFPSAFWGSVLPKNPLPRIPRISRTISVGRWSLLRRGKTGVGPVGKSQGYISEAPFTSSSAPEVLLRALRRSALPVRLNLPLCGPEFCQPRNVYQQ